MDYVETKIFAQNSYCSDQSEIQVVPPKGAPTSTQVSAISFIFDYIRPNYRATGTGTLPKENATLRRLTSIWIKNLEDTKKQLLI